MAKPERALNFWAADPVHMMRLRKIVELSQRTDFVLFLMAMKPSEVPILKSQIKLILKSNGITYDPPRGRRGGAKSPKIYTARVRFGLSVLMGILTASQDDGITPDEEGSLVSSEWVDRLINTYHLFLQMRHTTADECDVSFELFVNSWRAIQVGQAAMEHCENCGGITYSFHSSPAHGCPICAQLKLATLPRHSSSPWQPAAASPTQGVSLIRPSSMSAVACG